MALLHNAICGLSGSAIFFPHYLINFTSFEGKLLNVSMCFDFLYKVCLKYNYTFCTAKMVMRTNHFIMNILTLIALLKFCVQIGYLKKVIVMQFRQFMYITYIEIKYKLETCCQTNKSINT
jgi:hypothetical protein